jgi:hypothetical protein
MNRMTPLSLHLRRINLVLPATLLAAVLAGGAHAGFTAGGSTMTGSQSNGGPYGTNADFAAGFSSYGDHGAGTVFFDMHAGVATLSSHACAAPANLVDPAGGAAGAGDHNTIGFGYFVTSDTLPNGTPVTIQICVATAKSMQASYTYAEDASVQFDFADSGLGLSLNMGGIIFAGQAYVIDYYESPASDDWSTGLFSEATGEASQTITLKVGEVFNFFYNFGCYSRADANYKALADANCSASVVFGAAVIDADAKLISSYDSSEFPQMGACTSASAQEQLPSIPTLGPCHSGLCPQFYYCATEPGDCGGEFGPGICTPVPTECVDIDEPVCGCDDENFANPCEAAAVGVSVKHFGPCESKAKIPADLDENGTVDGADLGILLSGWGDCPPTVICPPDIAPPADGRKPAGDGVVDGADLGLLLGSWS